MSPTQTPVPEEVKPIPIECTKCNWKGQIRRSQQAEITIYMAGWRCPQCHEVFLTTPGILL